MIRCLQCKKVCWGDKGEDFGTVANARLWAEAKGWGFVQRAGREQAMCAACIRKGKK